MLAFARKRVQGNRESWNPENKNLSAARSTQRQKEKACAMAAFSINGGKTIFHKFKKCYKVGLKTLRLNVGVKNSKMVSRKK